MDRQKSFEEQVYDLVEEIPRGKVSTYGQLAFLLGFPRRARMVGRSLSHAPEERQLPCHRVVNARGGTAPGWPRQRQLLEREGVPLLPDGRVDLARCFWPGSEDHLMVDNQVEVEL